jgi:hypothetical protein
MAEGDLDSILTEQMVALVAKFTDLRLGQRTDGTRVVSGQLGFCTTYGEYTIETCYAVEIVIPSDYPAEAPSAFETVNRIPATFHKMDDDSLCLGAPLEVRMKFREHPTLVDFVEMQLIPYLFSHACWERFGKMPFGDRKHGAAGILDSYKDIFETDDDVATLDLLRILADDNYHGHTLCPCGSGLKLRHCHGQDLLAIKQYQSQAEFVYDHTVALIHVCKENPDVDLRAMAAKAMKKKARNRAKRRCP